MPDKPTTTQNSGQRRILSKRRNILELSPSLHGSCTDSQLNNPIFELQSDVAAQRMRLLM